ncbi:MAG TPA: J domain-containing protein [Candidatus Limnocylindrales bacterium]|jgi:curved DNA-binding protein CbpA
MPERPDHYKILQVDSEAEEEVIQAAYRRLARKYHPDVAGGGEEAAARMAAINAAWDVLRDAVARTAYDAERAAAQRPPGRPAAPMPPRRPGRYAAAHHAPPRRAEDVSGDWTSGRSSTGAGYDPGTMRTPDAAGAAGPPPGNPSGSVLTFGRYTGWSLGEIGRRDIEYVEWLDRMPIGRPYREEIDRILRAAGRRRTAPVGDPERRGLFRRR